LCVSLNTSFKIWKEQGKSETEVIGREGTGEYKAWGKYKKYVGNSETASG
jgi:hypothetical protein